jgi:hypothetical protein
MTEGIDRYGPRASRELRIGRVWIPPRAAEIKFQNHTNKAVISLKTIEGYFESRYVPENIVVRDYNVILLKA